MALLKSIFGFFLLLAGGSVYGLPAINNTSTKISSTKAEIDYRLPDDVIPTKYTVYLKVLDDFGTNPEFTGSVSIDVTIKEPTKTIKLHSVGLEYPKEQNSDVVIDENTYKEVQMITLTYQNELSVKHTINLKFKGKLSTNDMYGFYLSSYNVGKDVEYVATTQFQSVHARKAFPCFDEPKFKAVFSISISRSKNYNSLSNTKLKSSTPDGENIMDQYEDTPVMSTYLIAFVVSKFVGYGATTSGSNDLVYDVFCRKEAIHTADYAYYVGQKILNVLNDYTEIKYYQMGIDKMHQVAVPDFAAGAMENWGLLTYRETALLWDPEESTANYKSRVATVIAHEMAHMWFGDLVTLEWWSYTWLNEGFARYLQYYSTKEVETDWELEKLFVIEQQQAIFVSDAISSALPLTSHDVNTPGQIDNKFSSISYSKGASIIRMMNFILGEEKFKTGIRKYLKNNEYKNTTPKELWADLSAVVDDTIKLPATFEVIMTTWTEQSGFPVVTVKKNGKDAVLSQKQFLYADQETDSKWYIPVTYTTGYEKKFDKTDIKWIVPEGDLTITNAFDGGESDETGWIIVNLNENGYYRVNYEESLWGELTVGLQKDNFDGIDVINRAQIVDDVFNLARSGLVTYERALDVTSYLQNEEDYYPWYAAFTAFSYIRKRRGQHDDLELHIREMMSKLYESVSFDITNDDPHITILKTSLALEWACNLEVEDCVKKANEKFQAYKTDNTKIDPNIRSAVYCSALRQSSDKSDWDFLWNKFLETTLATEQVTILNALGCTKNEDILTDYLSKSINEKSGIRKQDARSVFIAVLAGNLEGVNVAYDFFTKNLKAMSEYYSGMNDLSNIITNMADRFTTKEQIDAFEKFTTENKDLLKEAVEQVANAIENARANLDWKKSELDDWLDARYNSATSITMNMSLFVVILVSIWYNVM